MNLRQTLVRLCDSLGPYGLLSTDRNHVQLVINPAIGWCDALLIDELLTACQGHNHRAFAHCALCQERLQQIVTSKVSLISIAPLSPVGYSNNGPTLLTRQRVNLRQTLSHLWRSLRPCRLFPYKVIDST